jgi:hypoxanthine phosphoribosyltransferase
LPRLNYVTWSQYGEMVTKLADAVAASGERFDLAIGIARGGMPVAMVVADRLGIKVDFLNVKSYTDIGERTKPKILSTITEEIKDKRVLVIDDLVDGGATMESITEYLRAQNPKSLKTAVLFTKPWSTFTPDYSLRVVDNWVVFPYERGEVKRSRAQKKQQTLVPAA